MALGNTTSPGHHLGREKRGARRGRGGGEKERRKEGKDGEEEGEAEREREVKTVRQEGGRKQMFVLLCVKVQRSLVSRLLLS